MAPIKTARPSSKSTRATPPPTEVETLLVDASKARDKLGWTPQTSFAELVAEMVREDLKAAERDELVKKHGYAAYDYND